MYLELDKDVRKPKFAKIFRKKNSFLGYFFQGQGYGKS